VPNPTSPVALRAFVAFTSTIVSLLSACAQVADLDTGAVGGLTAAAKETLGCCGGIHSYSPTCAGSGMTSIYQPGNDSDSQRGCEAVRSGGSGDTTVICEWYTYERGSSVPEKC
jgi:hypothetical protein